MYDAPIAEVMQALFDEDSMPPGISRVMKFEPMAGYKRELAIKYQLTRK